MTSSEIRTRFLEFFRKRGHTVIQSASLVTSDEKGITNPTLFNTAGMQPLIPYLLGKSYIADGAETRRLVDVQKCLRTVDIDDIGDKTHATFFEMLGNWSLGDYFKTEAINWSYEFLTNARDIPQGDGGLGLDPRRLYVTVFEGDANAPRDDEAAEIWQGIFRKNGIDTGGDTSKGESGRVFYMPARNNWWEAGDNGPCGPDTEMFYDVSNKFGGKTLTHAEYISADASRDVIEVWNDVFMQYEKRDGRIVGKLPRPSVDTGAGLERLAMTMQGVDNIYDTDLLRDMLHASANLTDNLTKQRIITDHIRASIFLASDGVVPSNTGRGYILRRLIRKAVFNTTSQSLSPDNVSHLVDVVAHTYGAIYPDILTRISDIKTTIIDESERFASALANGLREFDKLTKSGRDISGLEAFTLFSSYGLPIDLTVTLAKQRNTSVDLDGYEVELRKHQELSRAGALKKFKGGLADAADPMVVRYHTATHLLHQALHDVLGDSVMQKGSNITGERLRFDFTSASKMTDTDKKRVEDIVNSKITAGLTVNHAVMSRAEAEKTGARHFFAEKYGDEVSIYYIGDDIATAYSKEFCGGPHVTNTRELAGPDGKWRFRIQKEEAVAQGIRRIKAVLS